MIYKKYPNIFDFINTVINKECEDGNRINNDGCSSEGKIENNATCNVIYNNTFWVLEDCASHEETDEIQNKEEFPPVENDEETETEE